MNWKPITAEAYDEALNAVPPAMQTRLGFLAGEAVSGRVCKQVNEERDTYRAFVKIGDEHFEAKDPMTPGEFRILIPAVITGRL
jgi:hypothetical protein